MPPTGFLLRRSWLVPIVLATMAFACSSEAEPSPDDDDQVPASVPDDGGDDEGGDDEGGDDEGGDDDGPSATPPPTTTEQPKPEPCRIDGLEDGAIVRIAAPAVMELSIDIAGRTHRCAPVVVVAPAGDPWAATIAAPAAVALDAPLLLVGPAGVDPVAAELTRLGTEEVLAIGIDDAGLPGAVTQVGASAAGPTELALDVATHLGMSQMLAVPESDTLARSGVLARMDGDTALLPIPDDPAAIANLAARLLPTARLQVLASDLDVAGDLSDTLLAVGIDAVLAPRPVFLGGSNTAWLFDPDQPGATAAAAVGAAGRREAMFPVNPNDLRRDRADAQRIRDARPRRTVLVGEMTDNATWQLPLILEGPELPGGGFVLFEDRRIVALYGSPETSALGVLGEQPVEEAVPRLREVAEPYATDGVQLLPAFELIATIASGTAEPTGDYSRRAGIDVLRPWVDRATEEGFYVILDLQPGRTDFLTQAKEYEELLVEPHVGLAIDPEWRLGPDEVHLQQVGSVEAAEVQQVADWLATLTRTNSLPQKLLVLHQFQFGMLPDRDTIVAPPELAVVVHMDGQGSLEAKDETYEAITRGVEDRWLWGWKNFYDEDSPTATPERVLALDPQPVFVSYQ